MAMPGLAALIPALAPMIASAIPAIAKLFSGPPGLGAYGLGAYGEYGEPVGSIFSNLFPIPSPISILGKLFGGGSTAPSAPAPLSPPPSPQTVYRWMPRAPTGPRMPEMFYQNRPQFCQVYCPPNTMPGAPVARRRRHHRH